MPDTKLSNRNLCLFTIIPIGYTYMLLGYKYLITNYFINFI